MPQNKMIFLFGITRFEFIVTICIFLLAIYFILNKTYQVWFATERVTVQQIVNTLRTSLYYAMIKSRDGYIKMPEKCVNPMDFVASVPFNYRGALDHPESATDLDGQWYFDRHQCRLVYQWRFTDSLITHLKSGLIKTHFTLETSPVQGKPRTEKTL